LVQLQIPPPAQPVGEGSGVWTHQPLVQGLAAKKDVRMPIGSMSKATQETTSETGDRLWRTETALSPPVNRYYRLARESLGDGAAQPLQSLVDLPVGVRNAQSPVATGALFVIHFGGGEPFQELADQVRDLGQNLLLPGVAVDVAQSLPVHIDQPVRLYMKPCRSPVLSGELPEPTPRLE